MKGLLLKDWHLSLKYFKPYFLVMFVFAAMSVWAGYNPFLISYPFMLTSMMAPGLQNMDESYKWDVYCGSMPVSKKQIVCEKYLYGLIWSAVVLIVVILSQMIRMAINGCMVWAELAGVLTTCLVLIFFLPAISLPFVFKYGSEKGRVTQYLIIGAVCGGAALMSVRDSVNGAAVIPQGSVAVILAVLMLYLLSWFLSIYFYEKREIR